MYCCGLCTCVLNGMCPTVLYFSHTQKSLRTMSEDTPLIQADDGDEATNDEPKIDVKQMVWFHGKVTFSQTTCTSIPYC